ncbi:MAG TPA: QsdR family transcriptional regulator [Marmoricola sp.]|jgi:AcrR family transcriptional regulator|nr:QsdR family transcriptional regulator [Marmoricola sp.]
MTATPADAYAAATRAYLAGQRLDMRQLAGEVGVSRNTLYRWTGGREQLIGDVAWRLSEAAIRDIWASTARRRGSSRLLAALRGYVVVTVGSHALQSFVRNETYAALRLLTSRGPFQDRLVAEVQRLIDEEAARGSWAPRSETALLAYGVVRLIEGFVYNTASGEQAGLLQDDPAIDDALAVIRLLLD